VRGEEYGSVSVSGEMVDGGEKEGDIQSRLRDRRR